jgi:GNAT superfamily N-acetyltransferase
MSSDPASEVASTSHSPIRSAVPADGPVLCDLFAQLGYPTPVEDFIRRLVQVLADPTQTLLVSGPEGAPLGVAHLQRMTLLEADGYAQLLALVVDESQRSRGLGAQLVAAGEAWAVAQGCSTLTVRSNVIRTRTHTFYERLGYTRVKSQHTFKKPLAGS